MTVFAQRRLRLDRGQVQAVRIWFARTRRGGSVDARRYQLRPPAPHCV